MEEDVESYLSKDADTEGFDLQAGKYWIYPTNYPMREYQFRIIQEALYQNTMVSLPTGLGKTFIAAVVMYNFYRWYPTGKIIFIAPTRPLVKQQIDACYDIMAIPQNVTAELTGTKVRTTREDIWNTKRVFFITPQVLQNDLDTFPDLAKQIKCLVFDEAHKARGNHAYCEVIRKLIVHSNNFRVLALSATPGNSENEIIDVSTNLLVAHLEVRTEDSPDVTPYIFHRDLETVVVPLGGKLEEIRNKYLRVLEKYVKVLKDHQIIKGNCANLTKGKIFMTLKDFNHQAQQRRHPNHSDIVRTLNICITLYHGYELLIRHGMRGFLNFFEEHSKNALLKNNRDLFTLMEEVQEHIGPRPDVALLPDGTIPQIANNSKFGHPKFYKLRNIVLDYFSKEENKNSKIIIFSEFKETVMEAYAILMQHTPTLRPRYFMGQGAITQKQQINTVKSFKDGECNILVSTCIGEEGLDIGEVDLIICFDISNKSPIRLIQRMGRTGRKKQGKVIILVTEGKEQQLLKDSLANKNYLSNHILKSHQILNNLYKNNPRMIPENIFPTCQKMHISAPKIVAKGKNRNIKDMFNNLAKNESVSQILRDTEIVEAEDRILTAPLLWNQSEPMSEPLSNTPVDGYVYHRCLDSLRIHQPTEKIKHSTDTDILVSLLQFSDSKRYNLPVTQSLVTALTQSTTRRRKITRSESSDNFKQTDIRNMFTKPVPLEVLDENLSQTSTTEDAAKKKLEAITHDLLSEISSYMIICDTQSRVCKFCEKTSLCNRLQKREYVDFKILDWTQPDLTTIENLTESDFDKFLQDLTVKECAELLDDDDFDMVDEEFFILNETPKKEKTFMFEVPKSIKKVIGDCELSINVDVFEETFKNDFIKEISRGDTLVSSKNNEKNNGCSPEKMVNNNVEIISNQTNTITKESSTFFKLNNLEDLFSTNDIIIEPNESLDIFGDSPVISTQRPDIQNYLSDSSPIISSYSKVVKGSKIIDETDSICKSPQKNNIRNLKSKLMSVTKSEFYVSNNKDVGEKQCAKVEEERNVVESINFDESDLSIFGVSNQNIEPVQGKIKNGTINENSNCSEDLFASSPSDCQKSNVDLSIEDVCDISFFGLTEKLQKNKLSKETVTRRDDTNINENLATTSKFVDYKLKETNKLNEGKELKDNKIEEGSSIVDLNIGDVCDISFFGLNHELLESLASKNDVSDMRSSKNLAIKNANLTIEESPIKENNVTPTRSSISDSDRSPSPVLGYIRPKLTQKLSCKKSLFSKNVSKSKLPQLLFEDLCSSSAFDLNPPTEDKNDKKRQQQSPVLSQKFKKRKLLSTKAQSQQTSDLTDKSDITNDKAKLDNFDIFDLSAFGFDDKEGSSQKKYDTSGVTITQVIDLVNKSTDERTSAERRNERRKGEIEGLLLDLLDDDNVFENTTVYKTPLKSKRGNEINLNKTQNSAKKKTIEKNNAAKVCRSNSDDEFEKPRVTPRKKLLSSRLDSKAKSSSGIIKSCKKREKNVKNPFIETEAKLSSDEYATDDTTSEGGSSQDVLEMSFVNDESVANTTAMHAEYLQSVRSPARRNCGFKIPDRPSREIHDVFSQKENYDNNSYLEDSFCVDIKDSQISFVKELSELEIAERRLRERRKQKRKSNSVEMYKNRRRVIVISSDSE